MLVLSYVFSYDKWELDLSSEPEIESTRAAGGPWEVGHVIKRV